MSSWVNRTVVAGARNGTTSHTVSFTPATAGNLLVALAYGGVTSSTPTGWTLPANGSAINAGGLYLWYKTASSGESSFSTTHNASNYPAVFVVYEFAAGSAFVKAVAATGGTSGTANPSLTSMTGTYSAFATFGEDIGGAGASYTSATWSAGTEDVDAAVPFSTTDGYGFGLAYQDGVTASSWTATPTLTHSGFNSQERITFALTISTGAATGTATLSGSGTLAATGAPTVPVTAALSGSGALTAAGKPAVAAAASLTGSGTLTATTKPQIPAPAAFSGSGTLTAGTSIGATGTAALSGAGTLTASVSGSAGVAAFSGSGQLAAAGAAAITANANLAGTGTLAAQGTVSASGAAAFIGQGVLTATAIVAVSAAAQFFGAGNLTAQGFTGGQSPLPRGITVQQIRFVTAVSQTGRPITVEQT